MPEYFFQKEVLKGLPQKDKRPRFAIWNQEDSGSLGDRAKAYLHINCAHCHNDLGPAKNSGLKIEIFGIDPLASFKLTNVSLRTTNIISKYVSLNS